MQLIDRRHILRLGAGSAVGITLLPGLAWADRPAMQRAITHMFGERSVNKGRLQLSIPTLAENGYSVALDVEADSPMTRENHVKRIAIFSERNPIPLIASCNFTPQSGRAKLSTKVRLGGTQTVHAIAEYNDGTLWSASAQTLVTVAACVIQ